MLVSLIFFSGVCENFVGSFKCRCPAGWTGQTCGQLMDHCIGKPCKNGGRCVSSVAGYQCDCAGTGFQGTTCDLNINDCIGNPCLNNGRCVDGINNFTCDCSGTGYHGDKCEVETDDCLSNPCKNNGSCTDVGRMFVCDCSKTGFTGSTCDKDINECVTAIHQCGSGSTCQNTRGGYQCLCQDTYTGRQIVASFSKIFIYILL